MHDPAGASSAYPTRIVCLTEETTETLYLLGQGDRIVGISGYTVRPPEARRTKPKVSAFITARYDKILELKPDLVCAFSDLQADIARELIRQGVQVFTFNQRSVGQILQMIRVLGGIVGEGPRAALLAGELVVGLTAIQESAKVFPRRPRVFFEEWDEPLISGIRWVEELIEVAGGQACFPLLRQFQAAKDRVLTTDQVRAADPEIIIGSWCGKKVNKSRIRKRPGWDAVTAVRDGHIYEVKSTVILQPGPAALTEGIRQIHAILAHTMGIKVPAELQPADPMDRDLRPR